MKYTILILLAGMFLNGTALAQEKVTISTVEGLSPKLCIPAVREAYKRIGYTIDIKWMPGQTALEESNAGRVDAELQRIDGISEKFSNLIQISIPINYLRGMVYTKNFSFFVTGWHSLNSYKVGILKGFIFAEQGAKGLKTISADSYSELYEMLDQGQIDVIVMSQITGRMAVKEGKVKGLKELEGILGQIFLYHYVNSKNQQLVPGLEKALKEMLLDGTIKRLRDEASRQILAGG